MQNEITELRNQVRTLKRIVYGFGCLLVAGVIVAAISMWNSEPHSTWDYSEYEVKYEIDLGGMWPTTIATSIHWTGGTAPGNRISIYPRNQNLLEIRLPSIECLDHLRSRNSELTSSFLPVVSDPPLVNEDNSVSAVFKTQTDRKFGLYQTDKGCLEFIGKSGWEVFDVKEEYDAEGKKTSKKFFMRKQLT